MHFNSETFLCYYHLDVCLTLVVGVSLAIFIAFLQFEDPDYIPGMERTGLVEEENEESVPNGRPVGFYISVYSWFIYM